MKTGIKLKALLLGFSICASVGALAGTSALLSNNTQDEISASSVYADEQGSTPEGTETAEVAEISGSTVKYADLQEAINAAKNNDTVVLLRDTYANVTIAQEKNITLDLNGYVLNGGTVAATPTIANNGTLTVIDSSTAQTGTIKRDDQTKTGYYVIDNQGIMTIKQAIVVNNSGAPDSSSGSSLIRNGGKKTESVLTIENGTFTQNNFIVIKNDDYGTLTINGGTFYSANSYAVENWCHATLNSGVLNGSLFVGAYNAEYGMGETVFTGNTVLKGRIRMYTHGDTHLAPQLSVTGGTLDIEALMIDNVAYCDLSISGGTFSNYFNPTFLATGYGVISTENGYEIESGYIAQTATDSAFGKAYKTLTEAINGAESGSTVYLLSDASDFAGVTIKKDLTIDFGNYTVTGATGVNCFMVTNASVTFKASGKGGVNGGSGGNNVAILAYTDSTVTIESGNYTVGGDANGQGNSTVYVMSNGKAIITGGTFSSEAAYNGKYYVLNLLNESTGSFQVSGGTFINFDPATGDDHLGGTFVASGYVSYKGAEDAETVTYTVGVKVIKSVRATLGSDITMKFTLPSNSYTVSVTLMVNGKEQTITLENPKQEKVSNEKYNYIYQFTGLTPQMLDREFTITAYDKKGILRDSYTYSMLEYCNDLLAQDSVTSETKQVVAELLNYGAAAQKYVGADSSKLQDAIKQSNIALLTDEPQGEVSTTGTEQIVAGATVNFSNVNKIVFAITPENYAKLDSYTIKINDIAVEKSAWVLSGDYYMWYSDGIKATEFGKPCKLVVTNGSETVQTIEISVNAYCSAVYKMSGVPEALKNLVKATYNYGAAAKAYAESSK